MDNDEGSTALLSDQEIISEVRVSTYIPTIIICPCLFPSECAYDEVGFLCILE